MMRGDMTRRYPRAEEAWANLIRGSSPRSLADGLDEQIPFRDWQGVVIV